MDQIMVALNLIRDALKDKPGYAYIASDNKHFCLMKDELVLVIPGDYLGKSPEETNQHLQKILETF